MSNNQLDDPHHTRDGSVEKAGPSGRKHHQTTDSSGTRIEATRTKKGVFQSLNTNPPLQERKKQFRISHLNCHRSRVALDELTMVRSRDDALLITEPYLSDGTPQDVDGYVMISSQGPETRTCIYIREPSMKYTSEHESTHLTTKMRIGTRLIQCLYDPPRGGDRNPNTFDPMEEGEIRMGDFNAAHPEWMEGNPITKRGEDLVRWTKGQEGVKEVGPREKTHELGNKLDLIFTLDTPHKYTHILHNGTIENSDHTCQSVKISVDYIEDTTRTKTDYRKTNLHGLTETIRNMSLKEPHDADQLIDQLESIRQTLPVKNISDRPRLAKEVIDSRRNLNRAIRSKKIGKLEVKELRLQYRQTIRDHRNKAIDSTLEESNDNHRFFELSKRGKTKKAIPPQLVGDKLHRTHDEISLAMAQHHGADDAEHEPADYTEDWDIEPVKSHEIQSAIQKAPPNSTIGMDDINALLLKAYHKACPGHLENIFTQILRTGKHPAKWKQAIVVPIPKANKPRYDHPKSWRSIHLLSIVSKTLERVVLNRLQEFGDKNDTLGTTQFGSRRNTGTSDAFQIYKEWKKNAHEEGMYTTCIMADIEGGFDKVLPETLGNTSIDHRYLKWIRNWARNRKVRFRFNGREGAEEYVTNRGLPQGSPLSPYLFGAYVKEIVTEFHIQNVFIISYVDDLLICIKGKDLQEVERLGRAAWQSVKERARHRGMDFAENKTKTYHQNHDSRWAIGNKILEMRFLGYWDQSTTSADENSMEKHVKHWLTKANYSYNVLRAITQRTAGNKGLNMMSTVRLLHTVTRTIAWYGLEHYGQFEQRNKEVDSFLYETIKRLLDMPANTPHRSISAEYGLTPSKIQYRYLVDRIKHRHSTFPHIMSRARQTAHIPTSHNDFDNTVQTEMAPWEVEPPKEMRPVKELPAEGITPDPRSCKRLLELTSLNDRIIYTDGSKKRHERAAYGIAMFDTEMNLIQTDQGKLSAGKSINDAETTAILKAMELALNEKTFNFGRKRKVVILSDSKTGIDAVLNPKKAGPLAYLNLMRQDIEEREDRDTTDFTIGWVKGHSKDPGNELADHLAKTAREHRDSLNFTSHDKRRHDISEERQKSWEAWFNEKEHTYRGTPSRRLKKHRTLTRQDSSVLFRLKTNKGWTGEAIGTGDTPTCEAEECSPQNIPDDGDHKFTCPARAEKRPPNVETLIRDPRYQHKTRNDAIEWIRHHDHFGFRNKIYEVNFIKLRIGKFDRNKDFPCPACDAIFSRKVHMEKHLSSIHTNPSAHPNKNPKNKPFQGDERICDLCGSEFKTRFNKEKHMRSHEKGTTKSRTIHECDECGVTFPDRSKKDKHMAAHERGTTRFQKCEGCQETFRTMKDKKKHQDEACGDICHGCSQTFETRTSLKVHQRSNCGGSRS